MSVQKISPNVPFDQIPGSLPDARVPEGADLPVIAQDAVSRLQNLREEDMAVDAIWRDFLSMTGYLRTINSSRSIAVAFRELKEEAKPHDFKSTPDSCEIAQFGPQTAWINAGFTFKTYGKLEGNCSGIVSMIPDTEQPGEWKIWMLRTWLENFEGCGHPDVLDPVSHLSNGHPTANGVPNGDSNGTGSRTYGAVIVGGSQGGLACAGRLKALGVSYILLERNEQIGDTWANRYETLKCRICLLTILHVLANRL